MDTFPGAVGGFRIMKLRPNGVGPPMMLSIGNQLSGSDFEWQAKKRNTMVCGRQNEHRGQRPPVWNCRCGFWFYKELSDLKELVPVDMYGIYEGVWAMVAGWGKVVEHEIGVRVQYARPIALIKDRPKPRGGEPHVNATMLDDEHWLDWIKTIGLPVIDEAEIPFVATMTEIDMLERTVPPRLAQFLLPASGLVVFAELSPDGKDILSVLPNDAIELPPIDKMGDQKEWRALGYHFKLEKFIDENRGMHHYWVNLDADHDAMLHNHSQIERALRSPYAALYKA